jgi:thiamine biosynthesis lipoprotein
MSKVVERTFRAMGCEAVVVVGVDDDESAMALLDVAERRIAHLERCWTRFDEMSDISAINRSEGRPVMVDPSTFDLVRAMMLASALTNGACQPAYASSPNLEPSALLSTRLDEERGLVRVEAGVRLDPGSIGKGLAADMVVDRLLQSGASGALVSIGGDLRVAGIGPHHGFWSIGVTDPFGGCERSGRILVQDGGVSTSGLAVTEEIGGPQNVSVDPKLGLPLGERSDGLVSVTVVAGSAAEAEAWSTAILVDGTSAFEASISRGCLVRTVDSDGNVVASDAWSQIFQENEVAHV